MAPTRNRTYDDPRLDSSITKDKPSNSSSKARRNPSSSLTAGASSKHPTSGATTAGATSHNVESTGIVWSKEKVETLHAYRSAHRVDIPLAFQSEYNDAVLNMPGIGAQSPTMARKKEKRKISKDQAALAVRKHFNSQAISETDTVVEFLYSVKSQDQCFKLRFSPYTPR